jgi:hypothetical protein
MLPMKIFNYGQTQYVLYKEYKVEKVYEVSQRTIKQKIVKYTIEIEKYKTLTSLITQFNKEFERFVKPFSEKITEKGFNIILKGYKISQAFLSYLIQNEKNVLDIFDVHIYYESDYYLIENYEQQLQVFSTNVIQDWRSYVRDKKYNVKIYNLKETKYENLEIEKLNHRHIIINEKYYLYRKDKDKIIIYLKYIKKDNLYKKVVTELGNYFRSVNSVNSDDWNEYLKTEVRKLNKYFFDDALENLQNEYKNLYTKKQQEVIKNVNS